MEHQVFEDIDAFAAVGLPALAAGGDASTATHGVAVAICGPARPAVTPLMICSRMPGSSQVVFVGIVNGPQANWFHANDLAPHAAAEAVAFLVREMKSRGLRVKLAMGLPTAATTFSEGYHAAYPDEHVRVVIETWVYSLSKLESADPSPGVLRLATEDDLPVLKPRMAPNLVDMFGPKFDTTDAPKLAEGKVKARSMFVWVVDGQLVSQAAITRYADRARVGLVYTPPEFRGRGYGSACVRALTQHLLDTGCTTVCLHADQKNRVTNRMYQKLGYAAVCGNTMFEVCAHVEAATDCKTPETDCIVPVVTAAGEQQVVELSHTITSPMASMWSPTAPQPQVTKFWSHEQAAASGRYDGCTCEMTRVEFVTSIGTYMDSPYHFHPHLPAIDQVPMSSCILPGVVIDLQAHAEAGKPLPVAALDGIDFRGKAVLLCTGWSKHWGTDSYLSYPFVGVDLVKRLLAGGAKLVAIDTLTIDTMTDPTRPAHTQLLGQQVLIVENTNNLHVLARVVASKPGTAFSFIALPVKFQHAAAFPVRAVAMMQ